MKSPEILHIFIAIIVLSAIIVAPAVFGHPSPTIQDSLIYAALIVLVAVASKKAAAFALESDVEHRLWTFSQWGLHKQDHFKKPLPIGIILPILISLFSYGAARFMALLVYETTPKKTRAVRGFGHTSPYTYVSMTDWHNALIGATGIVSVLLLAAIIYFLPFNADQLARLATFYAFSNILPISKLDGTQILFGSKVLYATLATITLIFLAYAIVIV